MPRVALRHTSLLAILLAACFALSAAPAAAESKTKVVRGVKYETSSTPWTGGKKAAWEVRVTGKSGITKIYGMTWGSKVRGTERTFKNGNTIERLTVTGAPTTKQIQVGDYMRNGKKVKGYTRTIKTSDVRKVTTRTLKDGSSLKTIKLSDGTSREISTWTDSGKRFTEIKELDKAGNVVATKKTDQPIAPAAEPAQPVTN